MSWLFSQALVAEYSAANCLDGELSALSSGNPTPQAYLLPVKTMDAWSRFPSGITLSPLTESHGEDVLTWFLEGFPARTLAQPEKAQESLESVAECGDTWRGSLAKYDPDTCSWKTAQCLLAGDLERFSETWPSWGSMRSGEFWGHTTPDCLTQESASGLWPTPVKFDAILGNMMPRNGDTTRLDIHGKQRKVLKDGRTASMGLSRLIISMTGKYPKAEAFEELMAWPSGWTDLRPLEMARFPPWLQQHGECLEAAE